MKRLNYHLTPFPIELAKLKWGLFSL